MNYKKLIDQGLHTVCYDTHATSGDFSRRLVAIMKTTARKNEWGVLTAVYVDPHDITFDNIISVNILSMEDADEVQEYYRDTGGKLPIGKHWVCIGVTKEKVILGVY